jgi:hypothetical protein
MNAAALFAHTPFADWVLNTALYSSLILMTGRLLRPGSEVIRLSFKGFTAPGRCAITISIKK